MRTILLATLVALATPNETASQVNQLGAKVERIEKIALISKVISNLQPNLNSKMNRLLTESIYKNAQATGIDWRIAVAIMFQESSLTLDPQNCKADFTQCNDMGIGQVRYSIWGKELKIDKKRMVTDVDYAVGKVFKILAMHKESHGQKEFNWFTRYHSKTPSHRAEYMRRLNKAYAKINSIKD